MPFVSGVFLKEGITITSRGCPKQCEFCIARDKLIEFAEFSEGNIIQDNNICACSRSHWDDVVKMLKKQKAIEFKGGIDKDFLKDWQIEDLKGLRIKTLWLACDSRKDVSGMIDMVKKLYKAGFNKNNIYCYVLIGNSFEENEDRLKQVYLAGAMPFAQLYKNNTNSIKYSKEFKTLNRNWSRPAIYKTLMKNT
jgi:hypothetical protein